MNPFLEMSVTSESDVNQPTVAKHESLSFVTNANVYTFDCVIGFSNYFQRAQQPSMLFHFSNRHCLCNNNFSFLTIFATTTAASPAECFHCIHYLSPPPPPMIKKTSETVPHSREQWYLLLYRICLYIPVVYSKYTERQVIQRRGGEPIKMKK